MRRANLRALKRATAALDRVVDAHTGVCKVTIGSVAVESIDLGRRIAQAIAEAKTHADADERAAPHPTHPDNTEHL